jgi:hypothetical protein
MSYARSTSCAQGETLRFHAAPGPVRVEDVPTGRTVHEEVVSGTEWELAVPHWPSSLYRAVFTSGTAYFVVRAAVATSPVLVSIPFPTWEAYNRPGVPGEGLYQAEQPDRAVRVSFDRSGAGPQPEGWELGLLRWLEPAGYQVDYCSGLDLHDGIDLLNDYQLLVINGHDEYWSKQMRDSVEQFVRGGGNLAIFSRNTCWWQVRFEDDMRTMVCYRDAVADPVTDPSLSTVEWSSEPVNRPENSLTGVSFARGAGCWVDSRVMARESYTARFADHWVFEATGLRNGDQFGRGSIGYETDAADFEDVDGVPLATGRDGTPPSFVILASADLRHWRRYGKDGAITMGVHQLGAGTVFNAATINWGNSLQDPALDRITRNVIDRLSTPRCPDRWEVIGPAADVSALVVCDGRLYGITRDDQLLQRPLCGQNLQWRPAGDAGGVITIAAPREAHGGPLLGLYGVTADGRIRYRDGVPDAAAWEDVSSAPPGTRALAAVDEGMFAASGDSLWHMPIRDPGCWTEVDTAPGSCLTAMQGRLFTISAGRILTRDSARRPSPWTDLGCAEDTVALAAWMGRLVGVGQRLSWRVAQSSVS